MTAPPKLLWSLEFGSAFLERPTNGHVDGHPGCAHGGGGDVRDAGVSAEVAQVRPALPFGARPAVRPHRRGELRAPYRPVSRLATIGLATRRRGQAQLLGERRRPPRCGAEDGEHLARVGHRHSIVVVEHVVKARSRTEDPRIAEQGVPRGSAKPRIARGENPRDRTKPDPSTSKGGSWAGLRREQHRARPGGAIVASDISATMLSHVSKKAEQPQASSERRTGCLAQFGQVRWHSPGARIGPDARLKWR